MSSLALLSMLVTLAVPVLIVVLVVRAASGRSGAGPGQGHGVRQFFQYLLLLGLLIVTQIGIVTIASLALRGDTMVDGGGELARGLTFTVFGGGLLAAVLVWTRATVRADRDELSSVAWTVYLTIADLVLGIVAAVNLAGAVSAALNGTADIDAIVGLVVWGVAWAVHWRLIGRTLDEPRAVALLLIGSAIGWVLGLIGLIGVLAETVQLLLASSMVDTSMLAATNGGLAEPAGLAAAGAALWIPHWLLRLSRATAGPLWQGYLLVVGIGASLVITLTGASITLYRALVWLLGDPGRVTGTEYLATAATPLAVALVGGLSWWYHRSVFASRAAVGRIEANRIQEYLLAGIALGAAATGVALVVVALVDATVPPSLVAGSPVNSVLAAITLLVVGGPLWWLFWRRVQRARAADPDTELVSPTRRIYLVLLFGVAGVVAVIVVLVIAFILIDAAIRAEVDAGTVRDLRIPVGILIAMGTVSGYHWLVQRDDRRVAAVRPARPVHRGPGLVLLVGPRDDQLAADVRRVTRARVDGWDVPGPAWDHAAVHAALAPIEHGRVLLLSGPYGLQVVVSDLTPVASAADAGNHRDQPGPGGEQGEPELDQHAQGGGLEGEPRGAPGEGGVAEP